MESHGKPQRLHASASSVALLHTDDAHMLTATERGTVDVKGKGPMRTYFVHKRDTDV